MMKSEAEIWRKKLKEADRMGFKLEDEATEDAVDELTLYETNKKGQPVPHDIKTIALVFEDGSALDLLPRIVLTGSVAVAKFRELVSSQQKEIAESEKKKPATGRPIKPKNE